MSYEVLDARCILRKTRIHFFRSTSPAITAEEFVIEDEYYEYYDYDEVEAEDEESGCKHPKRFGRIMLTWAESCV